MPRKANVPGQSSLPDERFARDLLGRAGEVRVVVIGDAMLDRYVEGSVDRISPEAPVPVVHVRNDRTALGGAANVAAGVVALGAGCSLVAVAGEDDAGTTLRARLSDLDIDPAHVVRTPGRPTTEKTRILGGRQQMLRVDREASEALGSDVEAELERVAEDALEGADVLVFQDYDKGAITASLTRRLLDAALEAGVPTIVDPKLRHFYDFEGAWLFKPNRRELATGLGVEDRAVDELDLEPVLGRLGTRNLLLTLGPDGMVLVGADVDGRQHIPSVAREVFDVTGAGDTVLAVLAVAVAAGATLLDAARLATVAAGLEVSRAGAVPIAAEELLLELRSRERAARQDAAGETTEDGPQGRQPPPAHHEPED